MTVKQGQQKPYNEGQKYSEHLFHSFEPILKTKFCWAIDTNDADLLEEAIAEARARVTKAKVGRPPGRISHRTRNQLRAHACSILAQQEAQSYTDTWTAFFGGGQVKKPQCSPEKSARELYGYCAIDDWTRRLVSTYQIDLSIRAPLSPTDITTLTDKTLLNPD